MLLPRRIDSLSQALWEMRPHWVITSLLERAQKLATANGDFSLVGLASLVGDDVTLTAVRESVVLYAEYTELSRQISPPGYAWSVDPELERRAILLVTEFNRLFHEALPTPGPAAAKVVCVPSLTR